MPTYEYMCEKCEHEFEREQRITDPPVKTCPECRSRKVKKLISRTSFVLKGGGWYSDLYSSADAKKGGKDSKDSESKSSSDTKSESKPSDSKKQKEKPSKASSPAASKKGKSAA
ncbi:MAG: zinc ribbon domain-containing protein [Myxococcota bacterium]|nr:zinc ribbon domain-containing protein [Myxococcota bacterium]